MTRSKSLFISLLKGYAVGNGGREAMVGAKPWKDLFSPTSHEVVDSTFYYNQDGEFEDPRSSKRFPEYPIRSHREAHNQLQKNIWYAIKRKEQFRYIRSRVSPIKDGRRH